MTQPVSFDEKWKLICPQLNFRDELKKMTTEKQFAKFEKSKKDSIYKQLYELCIKLLSGTDRKRIAKLEEKLKEEQRINMGHIATINTLKHKKEPVKRIRTCKNCGKQGHDSRTCHLYKDSSSSDSESSDDEICMANIIYQGVMYQKNIETDEIFHNMKLVGEWDIDNRSIEWLNEKFKIIHESNGLYLKD